MQKNKQAENINKRKEIVIIVVIAAFFALLIFFAMNLFKGENEKVPAVNLDNEITAGDYIDLNFHVTGIDPVKGDMIVRVNADPEGSYSEDSLTLSRDIKIYTNSNIGKSEFLFARGGRINPFEISVDLHDGYLMEYPFDKHLADFSIYITAEKKDSAGNVKTIEVPIKKDVYFYSSIQGYKITSVKEVEFGDGYSDMQFKIERTNSVMMFSVFVMVLMWCMTISIILVVGSIVIRKRVVEYSMFAFLSAMIFALPALRDVQPFVPTIGCYSDYIAFFWSEATVGTGLVILIVTWLKRPAQKQQ
jgi:hypothetical protein